MTLIDLEMVLPWKKENAKTMTLESKVLIMTFTKRKKDQMNFPSLLMQKSSSLEEQLKHLTQHLLNLLEPKMITQD